MENEFWDLLCAGASQAEAAEAVDVSEATASKWVRDAGGVRPRLVCVPGIDARTRTRCLTEFERDYIAVRWAAGAGIREIGRELGRAASTISRELDRNGFGRSGYCGRGPARERWYYLPRLAQAHAEEARRRPKERRLALRPGLAEQVQTRLDQRWSPRQIAVMLKQEHPDEPEMWVSHETIYQSLYVQGRGGLRRELHRQLRTGRAVRKPRASARKQDTRIRGLISISERPAEAADRAVPGHWEGDLIIGKDSGSAIGTLVERCTRYCLLLHLPDNHGAEAVRDAMIEAISTLPEHLWRSLTWDRGNEMAKHHEITIATGVPVYFCDPHSPWQRGSNENTNGLLRQYFPKGTDLSGHSREDLDAVAIQLNGRPRETLDWKTPAQALNELLSEPFNTAGVAWTA